MKFFPSVLFLLLVFDGLQGLILPQEKPDKGLNTTLQANFSGLYVRRNPCNNEQMEASSYEASHEFHHHTKGSNWTEYTQKCSVLISNFLKSISNLINFNNKHDGTFTFHVNTSISQKQAEKRNCKDQRYSLPTIVIEATNYIDSEQSKKPRDKGLTEEGAKQEVFNGLLGKQKSRRNPEKAYGELTTISQGSSASFSTLREETEADQYVTEVSDGPLTVTETTEITESESYPLKNSNNLEPRQECENESGEITNKYVTGQPRMSTVNSEEAIMSQTDSIDGQLFGSTEKPNLGPGNQFRNPNFEIKPTGPFEAVTNRDLSSPDSQSQLSFNGVRMEASDIILSAPSVTQQPTNPLYSRSSQLPQNDNPHFFLTTVSPINTVEKIETIEETIEYDSEQSESLNAGNVQTAPFDSNINPNVEFIQPAESLDYLEKQAEFNTPKIPGSTTGLPEFLPTADRFEQEKVTTPLPPEQKRPLILKKSDVLPNALLTNEASPGTSNIGLGPQTHLDAIQPQPKNSFGQGFGYPISEKINQASSYSQLETHVSSSEDQTELYRDDQYYTTFPPKSEDPRSGGRNTGTPSTFLVDEFSGQKSDTLARAFESPSQKPSTSKINKKASKVFSTQPGQDPIYTPQILNSYQKTTPLQPAEALIKLNRKDQLGTAMQESFPSAIEQYEKEIIDQFQSSEQSEQNSETTVYNNQNFPEAPVYPEMVSSSPKNLLQPETVLHEGSAQPLDYGLTTWKPVPTGYDEKTTENLTFRPERPAAGQIANFNKQSKSFKSSKNRPPVPEPTTDAIPVTYGPQRKVVSSLEKEIVTTESSLREASQVKPNFFPSRISNYGSRAPPQANRFVSESSLTSDPVSYDLSDSLSTASSTSLPVSTVSESKSRIISQDPLIDYYDAPIEQSPGDVNDPDSPLNEPLEDSSTIPYSGPMPKMTTTVYESDLKSYSQENPQLDAPSMGIYEPQTTSAPRPAELNIPVEFQSNAKRSENYESNSPPFPNYGVTNGKNFDSFTTNYPTTVPREFQSETELDNVSPEPAKFSANQLPVGALSSAFSRQNQFSEDVVKTTEGIILSDESEGFSLKPLDYQSPSPLPKFQQPLGTSKNIPDRNQFPDIFQPQSGTSAQFSETTLDSSDVYSQQTSSTTVPVSASQEVAANTGYNDQQNSLPTVELQSENAPAVEESYYRNQNNVDTFSEQRQYDDIISSRDARTQIPQPQPSLDYSDYSGQLSSNERESNTAATDLQTSKTFEGSEPNSQPLLAYSPSPSVPTKTQAFTTETYESDKVTNEYPLLSRLRPESIGSAALEGADPSSPSLDQLSSDQNIETIDTTELPKDYSTLLYNNQFVPITPPPSLTAVEEPLPNLTPETFADDTPTTPLPQSVSSVRYDQEIVTIDSQPTPSPVALLPVNYSGQLLNRKKDQGFGGRNLAVTQQLEDRLERSDIKATASQSVLKKSNRGLRDERIIQKSVSNQDIKASSTAVIEKKYDASPQQLPGQSVTLPLLNKGTSNLPEIETYPNNFDLTSSAVGPVRTKTTFDEEVITTDSSNSLSLSSTRAPPVNYSQRLSDEQFKGQGPHSPSSTIPQPPRQFHSENRPIYYPSQGFPSQQNFENRPFGNYPQPLDFNSQAPRPRLGHFDNFGREQHNQFPSGFQHNQFESRFPASNRFQPGLDSQKDRFMFPDQPSNYGNRYLPNGRPNFSYPPSRPGMNSEPFSSQSQVPPNFFPLQHPNGFDERDSQYESYQGERRSGERNFNTQLIAPPYAQNYEPYSYYPRDDFNERFGPNYQSFGPESRDRFRPDHIPYNQMMPPYRNHPAGYFNPQAAPFLNNSSQQVGDRYQQQTFDRRADSIKGVKIEETEKTDINHASPEVLADYKKALTELASGERLVKFDEEVITISPEKGPSSETTVATEKHDQRQDAASYNFRNQGRQKTGFLMEMNNATASGQMPAGLMGIPPRQGQQGNFVFRPQNNNLDFPRRPGSSHSQGHPPFSQPVDSFGPQQPTSLPNFSNQFRSASSDFQQQSNANFVNPQKPNGGNEVGSNPSQSDSYALGPDQISPSTKPDPDSSRRFNVPSPYRNPVARPIAAPETFSSG